jgi:type VI secretion system protein ImpA
MDLAALLQPISAASPCGEDMSFSLEFDSIREKRREDDPTLDQGEWKRALKTADWPGVVAQCTDLLVKRTKDLRVAGWFTDASARTRGFAGLAEGLELCALLCEDHWEGLHPLPDGGDLEQRIGNLTWLLGQVPELAALAPVIASGPKRFGVRDIEAARSRAAAHSGAQGTDGELTADEVTRVQAATSREFISASLADARRALALLERLQVVVDARLGAEGPGFSTPRKALEDTVDGIERLARSSGVGDAPSPLDATSAETSAAVAGPASPNRGPVQTRAQALQQLRAVADFFRRTEPHSPVAYLADKAARWGEMPLHAWLRVVMKDPNALAHLEEQLGVEPPPAPPQA